MNAVHHSKHNDRHRELTKSDNDYIAKHVSELGCDRIARDLNTTRHRVMKRAHELGCELVRRPAPPIRCKGKIAKDIRDGAETMLSLLHFVGEPVAIADLISACIAPNLGMSAIRYGVASGMWIVSDGFAVAVREETA